MHYFDVILLRDFIWAFGPKSHVGSHMFCCVLQEELYKILHAVLVNAETREAAMTYIATALDRNTKKSQIVVMFYSIFVVFEI